MRKAREANLFDGFEIGDNGLESSHLQYVDDTLCIGKATVENLWAMKSPSLLRNGFGLKDKFLQKFLDWC